MRQSSGAGSRCDRVAAMKTTPEDVIRLAALSRLSVAKSDLAKFALEFDAILAYVGQLETLSVPAPDPLLPYNNVFREDGEPHAEGLWTKKLVEQFPEREGDLLSVKQIINND